MMQKAEHFLCFSGLVSKYDRYQDRRKVIQNNKNDTLHSVANIYAVFDREDALAVLGSSFRQDVFL